MSSVAVWMRALQLAGAMLLFGQFVFVMFVWPHRAPTMTTGPDPDFQAHRVQALSLRLCWCGLFLVLASALPWLAVQAQLMSGGSMLESLPTVLSNTGFGRAWCLRLLLALLLVGLQLALTAAGCGRWPHRLRMAGLLLSGFLLASTALSGHAAAHAEGGLDLRLLCEAVHLLAAGAWYGALLPFIVALHYALHAPLPTHLSVAALMTRRFSRMGMLSMGLMLVSGSVNAWFAFASVPLPTGELYEQLLLMKLVLVLVILILAAANRFLLAPQLYRSPSEPDQRACTALMLLRRNAVREFALATLLLALAAGLGASVPPGYASSNAARGPHAH